MRRQLWVLCGTLAFVATTTTNGQSVSVTLVPVADTFVRAGDPFATYGDAGALHVSAESARNAVGVQQGFAEVWLRFDAAAAVSRFDTAFGLGGWELVSVELSIDQVANPNHAVFNRGPGRVNVLWVADDTWTEGAGKPLVPGAVIGSDLSFHAASTRRDSSVDELIGRFEHADVDGVVHVPLELALGFSRRLVGAAEVTVLLTPDDAEVGLTFHSRSWTVETGRPGLTLVAQPASDSESPAEDVGVGDAEPDLVEPDEVVPASDPTAQGNTQPPGNQTGSDPGKVDRLEEDQEELEFQGDIAEDEALGDAGEDEEPLDVEETPDRCGAGLVVPSVLMLLAFRVVMTQIATRRRP